MSCYSYRNKKTCKFGDRCRFQHAEAAPVEICRTFERFGSCKYGERCKHKHNEKQICQEFLNDGECTKTNCQYMHSRKVSQPKNPNASDDKPGKYAWMDSPFERNKVAQNISQLAEDPDDNLVIRNLYESRWLKTFVKTCADTCETRIIGRNQSQTTISFEKMTLPFLTMILNPRITRSLLRKESRWIFEQLHEQELPKDKLPQFENRVILNLDEVSCHENWEDALRPVLLFFREIADLFPRDMGHPFYKGVVVQVFEKVIGTRDTVSPEYRFILNQIKKIYDLYEWKDTKMTTQPTQIPTPIRRPLGGGPEYLSDTRQPRHDNDFTDFRKIVIPPTQKELSSILTPYLPKNQLGVEYHHLIHDAGHCFQTDPQIFSEFDSISDAIRLDANFRLLREDFIQPIVRPEKGQGVNNGLGPLKISLILVAAFTNQSEVPLGFHIEFQDPFTKQANREDLWTHRHKRLFAHGSLVSIVERNAKDVVRNLNYAVVIQRHTNAIKDEVSLKSNTLVAVQTVDQNINVTEFLESLQSKYQPLELHEVSSEFFAYRPILAALKTQRRLPFEGRLSEGRMIPNGIDNGLSHVPSFMERVNTHFDLGSVLKPGSPRNIRRKYENFDLLEHKIPFEELEHFQLDPNQLQAFCTSLTAQISCIQGPPGTGKSYVGAKLVETLLNTFKEDITPILCLCVTNHALDQFLTELLKNRPETELVRVGSRSKSEIMARFSLKSKVMQLRSKSYCPATFNELKSITRDYNNHEDFNYNEFFKHYISINFKELWVLIEGVDLESNEEEEEEVDAKEEAEEKQKGIWVKVEGKNKKKKTNKLQEWISLGEPNGLKVAFDINHLRDGDFLISCNMPTRQEIIRAIYEKALRERHQVLHKKCRENSASDDLRVLRAAEIIGMTTSKAAELQHVIERLAPKILICEEAAEIFEAHILASISEKTEQLILIGDHQQLRPKPNVYELAKASENGFNIDVSLFERLVEEKKVPVSLLNTQRRMRPEIADFIRKLYPTLEDHPKVSKYPCVRGVMDNVVFFDHQHCEDSSSKEGKTKSNEFEADFSTRFAVHLLKQGCYQKDEIVIITPYVGQLFKIRQYLSKYRQDVFIEVSEQDEVELEKFEKEFIVMKDQNQEQDKGKEKEEGKFKIERENVQSRVRIATVDNFQGEEGDVVIFSTVRNNRNNQIGFLAENNRINVALSRARHGLFVLCNVMMLEQRENTLWSSILKLARERHQISPVLSFVCQNHPTTVTQVKHASDFNRIIEGGCDLLCDGRLDCGHACTRKCHPDDRLHMSTTCVKPCERRCRRSGHPCDKLCYEKCKCTAPVTNVTLEKCGHTTKSLRCHDLDAIIDGTYQCKEQIFKTLSCGHQSHRFRCGTTITNETCDVICMETLPCGHFCSLLHTDCEKREVPHKCLGPCSRRTQCEHGCNSHCGHDGPCPRCEKPCSRSCSHSKCKKKCYEPCAICVAKPCEFSCEHYQCEHPCGVPCERPLCNERCKKKLDCGCPCPGLCGEKCPTSNVACRVHSKKPEQVVDLIEGLVLKECDAPLIVCDNDHPFTLESFDGAISLFDYYSQETLLPVDFEQGTVNMPSCPTCRAPYRSVRRASRLVKRFDLEKLSIRFHQYKSHAVFDDLYPRALTLFEGDFDLKTSWERINNFLQEVKDCLRSPNNPMYYLPNRKEKVDDRWEKTCKAILSIARIKSAKEFQEYFQANLPSCELESEIEQQFWLGYKRIVTLQKDSFDLADWLFDFVLKSCPLEKTHNGREFRIKLIEMKKKSRVEVLKLLEVALGDLRNSPGWNNNGHVMQCPNGHFYIIANCGGAVQTARCVECDATIGGANHTLATGNRPANVQFQRN